jgi:hypothetical protein
MFTHIRVSDSAFSTNASGRLNAPAKHTAKYAVAAVASAVLFGTLALVGSTPAFAQAQSHDAAVLPHYYDAQGGQHWGAWTPPATDQRGTLSVAVKPTSRRVAQVHKLNPGESLASRRAGGLGYNQDLKND